MFLITKYIVDKPFTVETLDKKFLVESKNNEDCQIINLDTHEFYNAEENKWEPIPTYGEAFNVGSQ